MWHITYQKDGEEFYRHAEVNGCNQSTATDVFRQKYGDDSIIKSMKLCQASINLWEAMTTLAGRDLSGSDKAESVVAIADQSGGFGSELDLTVDHHGNWIVRIFSHDESTDEVKLRISRNGAVQVERTRTLDDVQDVRKVSF